MYYELKCLTKQPLIIQNHCRALATWYYIKWVASWQNVVWVKWLGDPRVHDHTEVRTHITKHRDDNSQENYIAKCMHTVTPSAS